MKRAIICLVSVGIMTVVLENSANAQRGRAVRAAAGRSRGVARSAVNRTGGRAATSVRQLPGQTLTPGSRIGGIQPPSGPISAGEALRSGTLGSAAGRNLPAPNPSVSGFQALPGTSQLSGAAGLQGQWQSQINSTRGAYQGQLNQMATAFSVQTGGAAPFSPAWYAQHPNAWKITHPYAGEALVAATVVGLASFLAIEAASVSSGHTTVVSEQATTPPEEQAAAASELAEAGEAPADPDLQWMPIGVFAFRSVDAPNATRLIHLAVSLEGTLRGTHYDLLSEETARITGAVDKNSTRVSWRIGDNGRVTFESTLAQLTHPQGHVLVHFPDGQNGTWAVARLEQ